MTLWFLATGCAYADLETIFGKSHVDWRDLLVEEIASMMAIFVVWPTGAQLPMPAM